MSRVTTYGYEVGGADTGTVVSCDQPGARLGSGTATRDTTNQRTGAGCLKCDGLAAGNSIYFEILTPVISTTYYLRAYYRFAQLPATDSRIIGSATNGLTGRVTAGGKLQLWNDITAAQVGSDSAATISTGSYYRLELSWTINGSTQLSAGELRLDGVTVASVSGLTLSLSKVKLGVGWMTGPGASRVCYIDDLAINTNAGSVNNTWPGDGKVVMLLPTADSAEGAGWTRGNGTAFSGGNGWDSVNNEPPVGIADLGGAGADTGQIRNAASNANSAFDATMTTYTAAGVGAADTVNAVIPWTATAAPVATSAKLGDVGVVSNPTITNINLAAAGTAGAFWQGNAAGTYPTGWKWSPGTITEAPSVTLGTAPVMRVNQQTASTRIAQVCFMGMYVDYTPGVAAAAIPDLGMAMTVT
jgi:hypothetical protein